jgi:hypothetical protein
MHTPSPVVDMLSASDLPEERIPGIDERVQSVKTKNHGQHRDFPNLQNKTIQIICSAGLHQGAQALGAQHLTNFAPILVNRNRLQIRLKGPAGGFLRPGTVATKGGRLPTILTLSHSNSSFLDQSLLHDPTRTSSLERAEQSYHSSYLISSLAV